MNILQISTLCRRAIPQTEQLLQPLDKYSTMDKFIIAVTILIVSTYVNGAWKSSSEDPMDTSDYRRDQRERRVHSHSKRHMQSDVTETKKRVTTLKPREIRKKPSGHLIPLEEDDMDNEEVVSVAIGPPPIRSKYEKARKKFPPRTHMTTTAAPPTAGAIGMVKSLLMQLSKEFLTKEVDENFVFGQYLGNSMKNLTGDLRLSMQHEILELILKYQKKNTTSNRIETPYSNVVEIKPPGMEMIKDTNKGMETGDEKKFSQPKEKEEIWPDFSNLAQIVGGR